MKSALKSDGKLLVTFGPPWYAPYGSHMQFFTRMPWVNILFSERTVMRVRARYRSDGAMRYRDVESGLNQMTVAKFEALVKRNGLLLEEGRYQCIKGLNGLGRIPFLRELFVNHISCVLRQA
jgi:hypothetical protein